jgi:hypothetical protein
LDYCREASHRPLQGIPADAPFHLPDPVLPFSWPFAYAPLIETRTRPSRPMLLEMSAPAAEILPSVTVSVELAVGSQLPLFVTMVTFQTPSKGCCAKAGTLAEAATAEAIKNEPMRLGA